MREPDDDLEALVGRTVSGKYRIDRLIGRGGMGAVYQATHLGIGKRVALKFLDRHAARDADATTRFQREAEAASAVESAHIVHIFDSGKSEDELPFLVLELLQGEDLRTRLRREGRLELGPALRMVTQVLRGLSRAHQAGIVHRDLKPDNVFLCQRDDDPNFVKIVDFGISKLQRRATADTLTRRGTVLGTAFYMSPEQAQAFRDIDGRADLFSLGAILFESLAGRPPHVGTAYEAVLIDICTKDAPDLRLHAPQVPEAVAKVVARALERDREKRFQSAEEFYDALAAAAPDLVDTSLRALVPSPPALRLESSKSKKPEAPTASGPVATGEGTAFKTGGTEARAARRRTLVAALVAALGAFALTAFFMTTKTKTGDAELGSGERAGTTAESPPTVSRTPAIAATAAPVPSASAAPAASTKPVASSKVGAGARSSTRPVKPGPAGARAAASASGRGPSGVAGNLKLNTREP
jgi:eukaryotic-like serine/threonine-protein kinase